MTYFKNVVKRNGITVPFDEKKIENAIAKAFIATGEVEARNVSTIAGAITLMVITNLRENSQEIPTVEDIQDRVESMLMKCDYVKTAKAYIYKKLVDGYIGKDKDWRVKENSTVTLSVGALILSNSGAITANYWLSEIYDEDIAEAHRKCFIHLHDLSMLTGYCAGWSLKQLIQEGRWSTSWASCRTNGPGLRRSLPLIPTWLLS